MRNNTPQLSGFLLAISIPSHVCGGLRRLPPLWRVRSNAVMAVLAA